MAERTSASRRIIRADGFEVVDSEGRVRVALGPLHDTPDGEVWGVSLRDADGAERAWMMTHEDDGCEMGLAHAGNVVARAQVTRDGETLLVLADPHGTPVQQWTSFPV